MRLDWPEKGLVGWRVQFSTNRKRVIRFFSDRKFNGNRKARTAAQKFADANTQFVEELLNLQRRLVPRSNTKHGMPGITRLDAKPDRPACWIAYWNNVKGIKVQRKFSIKVYGERKARALAVETRLNGIKQFRARYEFLTRRLALDGLDSNN